MNSSRVEAFSDGVMAIIITIMALNIPLPTDYNMAGVLELLRTLGIFFVSFIVVGAQWIKHHYLFSRCKEITGKVLWQNILYLFFLSLMPLFTRWIMQNPNQVIPAVGYDLVFFMLAVSFHWMQNSMMQGMDKELLRRMMERRKRGNERIVFGFGFLVIVGIFGLSFVYPALSIIFFIILPVGSSLLNLFQDRKEWAERIVEKNGAIAEL